MQPSAFGIVPSPGAFGDRWQSRWPPCCARCPTGSLRSLGCSPGVTPLSPERAQSCSPGGADPAPVWPHGAQQRGGLCPAACPLTPQPRRPPVPSTQVPVVPSAPLFPRPQSPRWVGWSRRGHRWWGAVGADTLSSTPLHNTFCNWDRSSRALVRFAGASTSPAHEGTEVPLSPWGRFLHLSMQGGGADPAPLRRLGSPGGRRDGLRRSHRAVPGPARAAGASAESPAAAPGPALPAGRRPARPRSPPAAPPAPPVPAASRPSVCPSTVTRQRNSRR